MTAGVAISGDRGRSWLRPTDGLDKKYGWAVAGDPGDPGCVFVALSPSAAKAHSGGNARAGIYRRRSDAAWELLAGGLPQPLNHMPYALVTHPDAPGYVLAGLANGDLWESHDAGTTWRRSLVRFSAVERVLIGF